MSIAVTDDDHFRKVFSEKKSQPVILFFTATWCGPCQNIKPFLEKTAGKYAEKLAVIKIDVDKCDQTVSEYSVSSMPTFILIVAGKQKDKFTGANHEKLQQMFEKAM